MDEQGWVYYSRRVESEESPWAGWASGPALFRSSLILFRVGSSAARRRGSMPACSYKIDLHALQ